MNLFGLLKDSSLGPVVIEDSVINQVEIDFSNVLDTGTVMFQYLLYYLKIYNF